MMTKFQFLKMHTMKIIKILCLSLVISMVTHSCGQQGEQMKNQNSENMKNEQQIGEALAQEILATFDKIVDETAILAEGKPDGKLLQEKLNDLFSGYESVMTEFYNRYLQLSDENPAEFGNCNSYLGEYRGKHVHRKDEILTPAFQHYNFFAGDRETVDLLSGGPVRLLDMAVNR
jgi:hypothetical protein